VRIRNPLYKGFAAALLFLACALANPASAQETGKEPASPPEQQSKPSLVLPADRAPATAAGNADLYCAGFIQYAPAAITPEIVGGEEEQEQRVYSNGDYVFINAGAEQGIRVGQEFSIVRPRGQMTSKFTRKKGWLGVYVQELGQLRVTNVKERVSVALITTSCETVLLGDLLRPVNNRLAPLQRAEANLDRFADPSGKQRGRIVMARDARELVSRDQIVYIDLGAEDNVKAGDYLTIYRPLGTGNVTQMENEEIAVGVNRDFGSERYSGGRFSNQSQRAKEYTNTPGIFFKEEPLTTREIRRRRPPMPRKIVGEMVILSVQTRTATAIITRVAQEVHTGDFVELH
jgi:hypothetical protein